MPDFWQHVVLPFKRPSWSMWIDQVKRRRKNGNKTERSRKSLIRERYDEVCIHRGSAKNPNKKSLHSSWSRLPRYTKWSRVMGPSWVSPSGCTEEADPEQQRMAEVADEPFGSGCAKGTSRCPLHPSAGFPHRGDVGAPHGAGDSAVSAGPGRCCAGC